MMVRNIWSFSQYDVHKRFFWTELPMNDEFYPQIICNFVFLFSEGVIKRPKKIQKDWNYQVEIQLNSIQNLPVHDYHRVFFVFFAFSALVAVWIFWSKFSRTKLVLRCSFASFPLNRIDLFNFCPKKHISRYCFIHLIVLFDGICWVEITWVNQREIFRDLLGNFLRFPPPTERVVRGVNRGTTFISSISTLWSRNSQFVFWFEVSVGQEVHLVASFQSGGALKKTLGTMVVPHPIGRSRSLEKLNFQGKRQDSTILIFNPLKKFGWKIHDSNKRSIWYIFLVPYFLPIISSKSKSTRELRRFGWQKTTRGTTIS